MPHPIRQRMSLQDRRRGMWSAHFRPGLSPNNDHYVAGATYTRDDTWFVQYIGRWVYDDLENGNDPMRCGDSRYGMDSLMYMDRPRIAPSNFMRFLVTTEQAEYLDDVHVCNCRGDGWWSACWLYDYPMGRHTLRSVVIERPAITTDPGSHSVWERPHDQFFPRTSWRHAVVQALTASERRFTV